MLSYSAIAIPLRRIPMLTDVEDVFPVHSFGGSVDNLTRSVRFEISL